MVTVIVMMVIDHHDPALRPVEGAEVEIRPDVIRAAPVETHAQVEAAGAMPVDRRMTRPAPARIDHARVVVRHVDRAGTCRLDVDVFLLAHDLDAVVARQVALGIGFRAQVLDRGDHVLLLHQEGVAETLRPLQISVHALEQFRKGHQRLHAGIPALVFHGGHGVFAAQPRMLARPARRLDDFQRVGRRDQHVREHAVGIQRHRGEHRVELGLAEIVVVGLHLTGHAATDRQQGGKNQCHQGFHVIASLRQFAPRGHFVPQAP